MQVPGCIQRSLALEMHERNQIFYLLWLTLGTTSICKKLLVFPPGTQFLIVATRTLFFIVSLRFVGVIIIIIKKSQISFYFQAYCKKSVYLPWKFFFHNITVKFISQLFIQKCRRGGEETVQLLRSCQIKAKEHRPYLGLGMQGQNWQNEFLTFHFSRLLEMCKKIVF